MESKGRSHLDALLNLLTDEVADRLRARQELERPAPTPPSMLPPPAPKVETSVLPAPVPPPVLAPAPKTEPPVVAPPAVFTTSHAASLMARLAIGVLLAVILINIPLNAQGTALARSIPSRASLVIANGLVVKEETSPDIYVYRDGSFRWITSMDAFQHFGYRWQDVRVVEPGFLNEFDKGKPIHVLLKCDSSPHIYRLENGTKRWIVDIPTFESEGHVWKDVRIVPCNYLRNLTDGDSIPPGRGAPPPPLP